ncbi:MULTISPECIES: META domain-containing protein [unclassified Gilliamella]|uniref:META domain-containing protein n=1 Tax=unclassified Gilliamella TaxID=2685620 RepID=UPI00130C3325|nr:MULTISPECIES: META domain-containing protein [unclassified Gilliamella]MWP48758.1 META domain-containing protein [Gilliamella sp. Lep-s35]MWP68425.1 META domain-containing protein [Gilliamella sp. Lep-s5]MWP77029.1 META domain-containing protein [Gilliamella sp. Lep-s21]
MKKTLILTTTLFASTLTLSGCGETNKIKAEDLTHHRFVLIKANGQDVPADKETEIEFGENMNVIGKMCNRFVAKVTLENEKIKAPSVGMTKMICNDAQLDNLDGIITKLITEGATVSLDKGQLTLKNQENELIYQLKDLM